MSNNPYTKDFIVTWNEFHRDARALAWKLLNVKEFKGVVCITRGGMAAAQIIARELEIRWIDTVCISTYDEQEIRKPLILKMPEGDGEGLLVVDDLVDTGTTLKIVKEHLPKAYIATVYAKPEGKDLVDSFITEVSQDTWIRLPWDTELNYSTPLIHRK
jgi:xanthine phosphoribosyltransferase